MKKLSIMWGGLSVILSLALTPAFGADADDAEHYEKRINQINAMTEKPGMLKIAIQRISTETGVPEDKIHAQHKRHANVGAAGLLIANTLAAETKRTPEHFLNQREAGHKWMQMAKNNKVPIEKINQRLDNLAKAMKPEEKKAK